MLLMCRNGSNKSVWVVYVLKGCREFTRVYYLCESSLLNFVITVYMSKAT